MKHFLIPHINILTHHMQPFPTECNNDPYEIDFFSSLLLFSPFSLYSFPSSSSYSELGLMENICIFGPWDVEARRVWPACPYITQGGEKEKGEMESEEERERKIKGGGRRKESKNWKDNKREKKGVIHQSNATKT